MTTTTTNNAAPVLTREQASALEDLANHRVHETGRWTRGAKLHLLRAIDAGALDVSEAARRYSISELELREWQRGVLSVRDVRPDRARQ